MADTKHFKPEITIRFFLDGPFFGPGPVCLLKEIERCGNVREACESCGFSYSKGWTILKRCEENLGYRLVDRQAGGQAGGKARVSDRGRDLMEIYDRMKDELSDIASKRFEELIKEYGLDICADNNF